MTLLWHVMTSPRTNARAWVWIEDPSVDMVDCFLGRVARVNLIRSSSVRGLCPHKWHNMGQF